MIHEYALEPELVATWVDRHVGRYFVERFGLGQPRIVSRYPKRWKRLVWEAFRGGSELDRKRLEELVERLSETMVKRRDGFWNPSADWVSNAEEEHRRAPFHAILARANPRGLAHVLVADELGDGTVLWAIPHGRPVPRTAADMAAAVASMLRIASEVVFVDPYFGPENRRHRRLLEAFLRVAFEARPGEVPHRIEIQCAAEGDRRATPEVFRQECAKHLPGCIPRSLCVKIVRLCERDGGEHLHNRFILTDLGGVMFGVGLDEGRPGATDDIHLLARAQYRERWRQYGSAAPAFDQPEPVIAIEGSG